MDQERGKFQYASLKFLYEMELVDDPQLINNLKLNIFSVSKYITEAEFLSSYQHKQMLIYVELTWLGRLFFKKRIEADVLERVEQLLPKFKFRVTSDPAILKMALDRVKNVLGGQNNENSNLSSHAISDTESTGTSADRELQKDTSVLQDSKTETTD